MDVMGMKVLAGFVFFVLAFTFGWIPYYCLRRHLGLAMFVPAQRRDSKRTVLVQCLHSLASGVMLATCLLHLLPESLSTVRAAMLSECLQPTEGHEVTNDTSLDPAIHGNGQCQITGHPFPVAEGLVALGFLLIYTIDSFIRLCSRSEDKSKHSYLMQRLDDQSTATDSETNSQSSSQRLLETDSSSQQTGEQWRTGRKNKRKPPLQLRWSRPKFSTLQHEAVPLDACEHQVENGPPADIVSGGHNKDDINLQKQANDESDHSSFVTALSASEEHPLATSRGRDHYGQSVHLKSVTLVSALCIHGFFDGVMLGLQTSVPVVTSLLLALSIHKSFVAVGLSLTLLGPGNKTISNSVTLLYVFLFACVAPLGLLVSAALLHRTFGGSSSSEVSLIPGCLQSFAVGTFLYVTLSEMLKGDDQGGGLAALVVQQVFLLVGFCIMAALRVFLGPT